MLKSEDIILQAFGNALRKLRKRAGHTQESLGFASGLQRNFIAELERAEKSPSLISVYKLANALGVTAGELVAAGDAILISEAVSKG